MNKTITGFLIGIIATSTFMAFRACNQQKLEQARIASIKLISSRPLYKLIEDISPPEGSDLKLFREYANQNSSIGWTKHGCREFFWTRHSDMISVKCDINDIVHDFSIKSGSKFYEHDSNSTKADTLLIKEDISEFLFDHGKFQ